MSATRFLLLPENRAAHQAVQHVVARVASRRAEKVPHPLFLHGPVGCGKSLLVAVLLGELTRRCPALAARVLAPDEFEALARGVEEEGESLRTVRQTDVLVLEDLQHLATTAAPGLCRVLDYRGVRALPTVCTATAGPAYLRQLPRRAAGRLAAGLVVALAPLGPGSRLTFLREKAQQRQLAVHPEVLAWLAEHLTGGGRQLDGALARLELLARLHPRLDVSLVAEQFREQVDASRATVERIAQRVGAHFQVEPAELQSRQRFPKVVLPRQVSMYLARQLTGLSLGQIGHWFGGRDHSTVLYACRKVEQALTRDAVLSGTMQQLEADLK